MISLRKYQGEAVGATWNTLQNNDGGTVVVLPTGTGKSLVGAELIRQVVALWRGRVLMLAGRKELVQQNAEEFQAICPEIPFGIYGAGLGRKECHQDIVFGQIQSLHHAGGEKFGHRDVLIIDEAHEIPHEKDSMYRSFLESSQRVNPNCRLIGLSATPYRMSTGSIIGPAQDGFLFQNMAYEYELRTAIAEGYLSPIITAATPSYLHADLSGVAQRGGEYIVAAAEAAMLKGDLVEAAVADMLSRTVGRRAGIIFGTSIAHCQRILKALHSHGERATLVTGESHPDVRRWAIDEFKRGLCRWLVNVQVLTVGFNARPVDVVALLRPTLSAGLLVQMVGRGTRLSPETGKQDLLLLDYARNISRHGPLDLIQPRSRRPGNGDGSSEPEPPGKTCKACGQTVSARCQVCPYCAAGFEQTLQHEDTPDESPVFSQATSDRVEIAKAEYRLHQKRGNPDAPKTLRVSYFKKSHMVMDSLEAAASEWLCFSHEPGSFPQQKAAAWWAQRSTLPVPSSSEEALDLSDTLAVPESIVIFKKDPKAFAEIRSPIFGKRAQDPAPDGGEPDGLDDLPF